MPCCDTYAKIFVTEGSYTVVSLGPSIGEDAGYDIKFLPSKSGNVEDETFARAITHSGSALALTAQTSPLILNVPGVYLLYLRSPELVTFISQEYKTPMHRGSVR